MLLLKRDWWGGKLQHGITASKHHCLNGLDSCAVAFRPLGAGHAIESPSSAILFLSGGMIAERDQGGTATELRTSASQDFAVLKAQSYSSAVDIVASILCLLSRSAQNGAVGYAEGQELTAKGTLSCKMILCSNIILCRVQHARCNHCLCGFNLFSTLRT